MIKVTFGNTGIGPLKQVKIFQTYKYQCCAKNKQNLTFDNQFMDDYHHCKH